MCEYAFSRGEENSEIVAYLQRYFHGTKEEMLAIFEAGNKGGMYDRIFVESVLKACIADGVDGTEFKVFSTYIQQVQTDTALIAYPLHLMVQVQRCPAIRSNWLTLQQALMF